MILIYHFPNSSSLFMNTSHKKNLHQSFGFTLVELIVVVTILAILAAIAIVSYSGFTNQARDSQRRATLTKIANQVQVVRTPGAVRSEFYVNINTGNVLPALGIAGYPVGTAAATYSGNSIYKAGDVNYEVLRMSPSLDPSSGTPYKIGISYLAGDVYQVAASLENKTAFILGDFTPRTTAVKNVTFFNDGGTQTRITVSGQDANFFKTGDQITVGGTNLIATSIDPANPKVVFVSSGSALPSGSATTAALQNIETLGLIASSDPTSTGAIVVQNGQVLPYSIGN
jgi:prepilin-type N-terminal cleavage/methylation domain-containing protein